MFFSRNRPVSNSTRRYRQARRSNFSRIAKFRPRFEVLEERALLAVFTVLNTDDAGPDSLRWAIQQANTSAGHDTIAFHIPGSGAKTISLATALPTVTDSVTIDATTQPGYVGTPLIELTTGFGSSFSGLTISAGNSTIRGLAVNGFTAQSGIVLVTNGGNVLESNYVGVDVTGTDARPNRLGIRVQNSPGNLIGGADAASRNIVSGNSEVGVLLHGQTTTANAVQGNYIGTDVSGTIRLGNGGDGVRIDDRANANWIGTDSDGNDDATEGNLIAANHVGVKIAGSGTIDNVVAGNLIGTNAASSTTLGQTAMGVWIFGGAQHNRIGTDGNGVSDEAERNIIAGNTTFGVEIGDASTGYNIVAGNYIGTNVEGTERLGNTTGVMLRRGTQFNRIGVDVHGVSNAAQGNVVSGNNANGIWIEHLGTDHNLVAGNFVGTTANGSGALHNAWHGVHLVQAASNTIGGITPVARNLISGNEGNGMLIEGNSATNNVVQGNYVGVNANGDTALANRGSAGIRIQSPNNLIGGSAPGAGNLISGNRRIGIGLVFSGATNNVIEGNYVGTNADGSAALGNGGNGIEINSASNNVIGGAAPGAGNVLSGNAESGIALVSASGMQILGNTIGTNAAGTEAVKNGLDGIYVQSGASNVIGGSDAPSKNVISGNQRHGLFVLGNSSNNEVLGNYIGTNAAGTHALRNGQDGVHLNSAHGNQVGGTSAEERNVISGNQRYGLAIVGSSTNNRVQGNYIGTTASGDAALGNVGGSGVFIQSPANIIGGTAPGAGNVISGTTGNFAAGVRLLGTAATMNTIQGNLIGTDRTGMHALPNALDGVRVDNAPANLIGGSETGAGNIISGNGRNGIFVLNTGAVGNIVQGNAIGLTVVGGALGNTSHGIIVANGATFNTFGATGRSLDEAAEGNGIAFNGGAGVTIPFQSTLSSTGNTIRANSIHSNNQLGIDLGSDGVTANDPADIDTGPNNYQNFPIIASAQSGTTTRVFGSLNSRPDSTYFVDFYANTAADPSGHGPGERWLGFATVTTDARGDAAFELELAAASFQGEFISATATDADGNTSEFSGVATAAYAPPVAAIQGVTEGFEGTVIELTSIITSVSSEVQQAGFSYAWTVTRSRDNGLTFESYATGDQSSLTLEPADDGLYRVELLATDSDGQVSDLAVHEITVDNVAPTATLTSHGLVTYGTTLTVSLGDPQDPSTADTDAGFRYAFALDASGLSSDYGSSSEIESQSFLLDAGTYTVYARIFDKDGGFSEYSTEVSVTPAPLTVTVHDTTKIVGESNPPFTVTYDGFVLGQDETYLVGELAFQTEADETSQAGNYAVHASGWESNNYAIQYEPGNLAVTALVVGVDIQPESLNLAQNGMISVVIFGSEFFNASGVDWQSVHFRFSDAVDAVFAAKHSFVDVDGDGNLDLVLHFSMRDLRDSLLHVYEHYLREDYDQNGQSDSPFQEAELSLAGAFGEHAQEFQGTDSVRMFLAGKTLRDFLKSIGLDN